MNAPKNRLVIWRARRERISTRLQISYRFRDLLQVPFEFVFWRIEQAKAWIHDRGANRSRAGNVVAAHYRLKDGSWRNHPQGVNVRPLVIGELFPGEAGYRK